MWCAGARGEVGGRSEDLWRELVTPYAPALAVEVPVFGTRGASSARVRAVAPLLLEYQLTGSLAQLLGELAGVGAVAEEIGEARSRRGPPPPPGG